MRKTLIAVAAALFAVAAFGAASASAAIPGATADISSSFSPQDSGGVAQLNTLKSTKGALVTQTTNVFNGGGGGTALSPAIEPVPTTNTQIVWDKTLHLNPAVVPVASSNCQSVASNAASTNQDTEKACGESIIGGGYATICAALSPAGPGNPCTGGPIQADVIAIRGPDLGPDVAVPAKTDRSIIFFGHADNSAIGPVTSGFTGHLSICAGGAGVTNPNPLSPSDCNSKPTASTFYHGPELDVDTTAATFSGAAAITNFSLEVNNGAGALMIPCPKVADGQIDYQASYTFFGGTPDPAAPIQHHQNVNCV